MIGLGGVGVLVVLMGTLSYAVSHFANDAAPLPIMLGELVARFSDDSDSACFAARCD
jgi:hypothetical protein